MASELRVDKIIPTDGVASDSGGNRYGGGIVQILQHTDSTSYNTSQTSYQQGPQTPTFTLKYPTSKVKVTANFMVYADARSGGYLSAACALYRGSVASGTRITSGSQPMQFASGAGTILSTLNTVDSVLCVINDTCDDEPAEEIDALIVARNDARANRDWAKADEIRAKLDEMNVVLEDTQSGTIWKRK